MKDNTRVIAALLIGAAAGAALGLLLAPEKGDKLRGDIADYIEDLFDSAKDKALQAVSDAKDYGSNLYDQAKSRITGAADDLNDHKGRVIETARAKGRELKHEVERRGQEAKAHLKNGSEELKEAAHKA